MRTISIGSFLLKRHSSSDKVSFGIGIVDDDQPRPKKTKGNNRLKCLYF